MPLEADELSNIQIIHGDCMEAMKAMPDKAFELAICDPPYGVGQHFNFRYGVGDKVYQNNAPLQEYFNELFRVSTMQIIWGGNYFTDKLPVSRCWICWYKGQPINAFSDFELAWTNYDQTSRSIKIESYGFNHADTRNLKQKTIHPTQKPVALYQWLLKNYAKHGDKILDTHGGSCSIAIACDIMGFDCDIWEIDADYHRAAVERFERHKQQTVLEFK
jgi:site-specific DNA-methyltransferase (adenine-specific)